MEIAAPYSQTKNHLAIENHEMYSYRDLVGPFERLSCPHIGVCIDTVNSQRRGEDIEEVSEALLPFAPCLYVKDFIAVRGDIDMGFTIVGVTAGEGKLNIPDQLARLKNINPEASVILKQWLPFTDTIEHTVTIQEQWAEKSIAYLKRVCSEALRLD
jgi:sugar phosphate isomerase/epimerase